MVSQLLGVVVPVPAAVEAAEAAATVLALNT